MNGDSKILGGFTEDGFSIEELGDHIIALYFKDKQIAIYNQLRVTPEILQGECQRFIDNLLVEG